MHEFECKRSFHCKYFLEQVEKVIFLNIPVAQLYLCGFHQRQETIKDEYKWHVNKWYKCKCRETLWEIKYLDFPAKSFLRKFEDGVYSHKEQ